VNVDHLGPVGRTVLRAGVHLMYLLSSAVGDDWFSKRIRTAAMRSLGARIGPGSALHGGSYFTIPARLTVGTNCFINRSCYVDLQATVTIGDEVTIGHGTTIITSHHEIGPSQRRAGKVVAKPVVINDGVWIGANVTIMPGVTIGQGAVVGAGAVVIHDVGQDACVVGVPARSIRQLSVQGDGATGSSSVPQARGKSCEPTTTVEAPDLQLRS
jgi:maltose O-acetyltransferase